MKQDMELIKIMLQTLADNENYYMLLDTFAKQIQEKTDATEPFNDKFGGHFFLARDTKLIEELKEFDNGFRNLMDKCGIEHKNKKTLYSFRHTYISRLIEKGVPVKNIASQCGTSIEMIEKFYDNKNSHMANREWLFVA